MNAGVRRVRGVFGGPLAGSFSISTEITGEGPDSAAGNEQFTIHVKPSAGSETDLTVTGYSTQSLTFPVGTTVTLTESLPPSDSGSDWSVLSFIASPNVEPSDDGKSAVVQITDNKPVVVLLKKMHVIAQASSSMFSNS